MGLCNISVLSSFPVRKPLLPLSSFYFGVRSAALRCMLAMFFFLLHVFWTSVDHWSDTPFHILHVQFRDCRGIGTFFQIIVALTDFQTRSSEFLSGFVNVAGNLPKKVKRRV